MQSWRKTDNKKKCGLSRTQRLFEVKDSNACNENDTDGKRIVITTILDYYTSRTSGCCAAVWFGKIFIRD